MEISPKALAIGAIVVVLTMMMAIMSCGTRSKKKPTFKKSTSLNYSTSSKSSSKSNIKNDNSVEESVNINYSRKIKKELSSEQKRSAQLYKRLDNSYEMYKRKNYESALSEVESVMRNLHKDPYLEAQTWAMSAMIYDKQHKNSRRKRAYRKMVECIENLQKDSRYTNMYKEGMENFTLFEKIKERGGSLGEDE